MIAQRAFVGVYRVVEYLLFLHKLLAERLGSRGLDNVHSISLSVGGLTGVSATTIPFSTGFTRFQQSETDRKVSVQEPHSSHITGNHGKDNQGRQVVLSGEIHCRDEV